MVSEKGFLELLFNNMNSYIIDELNKKEKEIVDKYIYQYERLLHYNFVSTDSSFLILINKKNNGLFQTIYDFTNNQELKDILQTIYANKYFYEIKLIEKIN